MKDGSLPGASPRVRGWRCTLFGVAAIAGSALATETRAPACFASWIAAVPTPEPAAWRRTTSPAARAPSRKRFRYAVNHASGTAAASSNESRSGIGISIDLGTATFSA